VDLRTPKHGGRSREGHRERDIGSAGTAAGGVGTGEVRVSKTVVTVATPSFTLVQS
jgi:hypothetical protein